PFALSRQQELDLAQSFSRGLTHGFLSGVNHQTLVHGRFPKSRGVRLGTVVAKNVRGVVLELDPQHARSAELPFKLGDGVVFDEGHPEQDEQGGRLFAIEPTGRGRTLLIFGREDVNLAAIPVGAIVWKTDDPALRRRMEQTFSRDLVAHRAPLDVEIRAAVDAPLQVLVRDVARSTSAEVTSEQPLARAERRPLTVELIREQFGRLGDTPFELRNVKLFDSANPGAPCNEVPVMAPKSVLNELRRLAVERLLQQRHSSETERPVRRNALDELRQAALHTGRMAELKETTPRGAGPSLTVLVRSLEQLDAVLEWQPRDGLPRPAAVVCDFEEVRRYADAVARCRSAGMTVGLATLRIVKPAEEGWLRQIGDYKPDFVLVRNLAAIDFYREKFPHLELRGDYALNVSNELTAALFIEQGLTRLTPSYDLNWQQFAALMRRFPVGLFEVVVHQHMPMFHMEHCVFAATLSNGKDYRDCGRPCEHHQVDLRDRVGQRHPLVADVGCRNTVFNSNAQSAAEYLPRMLELGLRHFRVELLREERPAIAPLLDRYARVIAGLDDGRTTWRSLQVLNQLGVTRGTLDFA
ncbi:MAG TPA: DUF3656 domain-containing protein, partial [Planctomycetaceae bacterium]|nr:DUF3656 domain-containing protein [Planctomycetaceae bacterium]